MTVIYRLIGTLAMGLALAGIVVPGLPTTPFVLMAAWAFARGSPALAARLEAHRRLGPLLRNWREHRAVPRRAKILAILSMTASFAVLCGTLESPILLTAVGVTLLIVASYLLSRPTT